MLIPLFDIDGTLVNIDGSGRRAMALALEEVFGNAGPIEKVNFAGKTDLAIIYETMLAAGLSTGTITNELPDLFRVMVEKGSSIFFEDGLSPCPGAIELIERLANHRRVVLGLLTGNIEGTAHLKLMAAGFDPARFRIGAFGSGALDRADLAPMALNQARALVGSETGEFSAIIIGDTPADITCGHASNIPVLAVGTGTSSMKKLAEFKPEFMVQDLSNTDRIIDLLFSNTGESNGRSE